MTTEYLINRDVDTLDFPDTIYGLGGAGKEIVLQLFEQDWFAIEAMRGRYGTIDIHLVDTATENRDDDDTRVRTLDDRTNDLEYRMHEHLDDVSVGELTFETTYVTENINTNSVAHINGQESIQRVLTNTDADYWWVTDRDLADPSTPGDLLEFRKGVIRRRALGKAFHYKAMAEDTAYQSIFNLPGSNEYIAIFAGLAGGTGSGMAIDVARKLRQDHPATNITLFATLPTLRETADERANAYAALSELEHFWINEDGYENRPFNNIVLFPLDPTGHETEVRDPKLLEVDKALSYAVIGYYNNKDIDTAVKGATGYAPFTMAVPQVIQYNIQAINEAKQRATDTLDRKRKALNAEAELYDLIEDFLDEHYPEVGEEELSRTDIEHLKRRLRQFREFVEFELFDQLEYDAVDVGEELLVSLFGTEYEEKSLDDIVAETELETLIGIDMQRLLRGEDTGERLEEASELT